MILLTIFREKKLNKLENARFEQNFLVRTLGIAVNRCRANVHTIIFNYTLLKSLEDIIS